MQKKHSSFRYILLAAAVMVFLTVSAATVSAAAANVYTATGAAKQGWKTLSNGKIRYFGENGKYYKGFHMIDGKRYYFNTGNGFLKTVGFTKGTTDETKRYYSSPTGELYTNALVKINGSYYYFQNNATAAFRTWLVLDGKKYYFMNNYKAATGITKIAGKYYVFSDTGVLRTKKGVFTSNGNTYLVKSTGEMIFAKVNGKYYNASNEEVSFAKAKTYEVYLMADQEVARVTNSSMTAYEKRLAVFNAVAGLPIAAYRNIKEYYEGWDADYASDIFMLKSGDCFSAACAVGYMFKVLGYPHVYMATDYAYQFDKEHGWCELNGLVYDPLFAVGDYNLYGGYENNFEASYSKYIHSCALRLELLPEIQF